MNFVICWIVSFVLGCFVEDIEFIDDFLYLVIDFFILVRVNSIESCEFLDLDLFSDNFKLFFFTE